MNEVIETLKLLTMFGGGGILGGVLMTYKIKAEMMSKKECGESRSSCSRILQDTLHRLENSIEGIRSDIYVIRNGSNV